ncbi:MAG TPA: ammonia-forming cytochrome c nitrite reductase subunit c552 [Smithellaceae bacterium]|nr:ammonia-forming cytochrome c nitrite reductase subunit c552 [Smithellaceae bacterium]HRS89793.1 ammonia-forming cytochrome c nitrite reductase subunit c552 [Smithellaceae bacterium]HRV25129.1 ammonia-forming cytochrome c nitrite reductase subunit c552 [Smithellaceae bacterium]
MKDKKNIIIIIAVIFALILVIILARVFVFTPSPVIKLATIPEGEHDPAVWGKYYPLQYKSYLKNKEMAPTPTGFGGSVNYQKSTKEPEILMNFQGMPFGKDYSEDRGHPYSLQDLKETKRIGPESPGSCMTCKTANLIDIYKDMGDGYSRVPLMQLFGRIKHPITCANCHDPASMNLRVVVPAFIEAMQKKGIDVKKASREQMRSYVCGQCHSEYYFAPPDKKVVFPWDKGLKAKETYAYYTEKPAGFEQDWLHPVSGVKMLKAQHPDFELWSTGVHAQSAVSCADCHMPYMRKDGRKYSSHWVTSPMKHVESSCLTCHKQSEKWIMERVKTIQNNVWEMQRTAGTTIARAHEVIGKAAKVSGVNKTELEKARELVRKAQWFWDFIAAENSMGFHSPAEALNTLGLSVDFAHQAIAAANRAAKTHY